jgi:hypothetical protein
VLIDLTGPPYSSDENDDYAQNQRDERFQNNYRYQGGGGVNNGGGGDNFRFPPPDNNLHSVRPQVISMSQLMKSLQKF